MRTVVEEYQVMTFDELTEDQQEKAIEKNYDINVDHGWWEGDYHLCLSEAEMKSRRIKFTSWEDRQELHKDAFNSRGNIIGEYPAYTGLFSYDKIYFEFGSHIQFEDLEVNCDETFRKYLRIPKRLWEVCSWSFYVERYSSCQNSTTFSIDADKWDERLQNYTCFTDKQQAIVDRAEEIMNDKIADALSDLQKDYDYLTSEKGITEHFKEYGTEFTADGSIA